MSGPGPGPEVLPTSRRPFRGSIARRLNGFRQIHSRRQLAEVFPWMEHSAAAGAIVGSMIGYAINQGMGGLILGLPAGALGGAWLALGWASEVPASDRNPNSGSRDLWDPWLDEVNLGAVEETQVLEDVVEIDPGRARVRPRVFSESGESLPLENEIGLIFAEHERGAVRVYGPDGSGKSTALVHLARLMPPHLQVTFFDNPDPQIVAEASTQGRVIFSSGHGINPNPIADLKLAPWDKDEWIEYLLAGDRSRCAPVMARLSDREVECDLLEGIPELWRIVLDNMAEDESIEGPRQALRVEFDRIFVDPDYRKLVEGDCLDTLVMRGKSLYRRLNRLRRRDPNEALFRLIRHRAIQLLLAADRLTNQLAEGNGCQALTRPIPRDLVREAALRIAGRPEVMARLRKLMIQHDEVIQPQAASLLHATRLEWCPAKPTPCLKGAYLEEARWAGVVLAGADMREADLSRSDLWGARLDGAQLEKALLTYTDFRTASLRETQFQGADLRRAILAKAHAEEANFESALLIAADLEGAILHQVVFRDADLTDARFAEAGLIGADLSRAKVDGADFSRANLNKAFLREMKLAGARFEGAQFAGADLSKSDLEGMVLPRADFIGARFIQSLLTGSCMPGADFRCANFYAAGLANVEWERADLRRSDLREVAFHLGSSRSGLVNSTIASEGSRTGFYTDDYNDQDFKAPEEIRKANLQGVDLRGAIITGVDFYLVDLRGAKLDPEQVEHLRQTGAILESRG